MLHEQLQRLYQQIVKVQGVCLLQPLLVASVYVGYLLRAEVALLLLQPLARSEQVVLCVRYYGQHLARRIQLVAYVQFGEHVAHQPVLVVGIVYRERARVAQLLDIAPEYARAAGVKRAYPGVGSRLARQGVHALQHLPGRLVGKGKRQYAVGGHSLFQQIGYPVREHARLARAGARQHQQRPLRCEHRAALRLVEYAKVHHFPSPASSWSASLLSTLSYPPAPYMSARFTRLMVAVLAPVRSAIS